MEWIQTKQFVPTAKTHGTKKASLKTRKTIAGLTRFLAPLFGHWVLEGCWSCGIHEAVVPEHSLAFSEGTGCIILCEGCWRDLSLSEKIKYYRQWYDKVIGDQTDYEFTWEQIEMAIKYPYYWRNKSGAYLSIMECD